MSATTAPTTAPARLAVPPAPATGARTTVRLLEIDPSAGLVAWALAAVVLEVAWLAFDVTLAAGPTMPLLPSLLTVPGLAWCFTRQTARGGATAGLWAPSAALGWLAAVVALYAWASSGAGQTAEMLLASVAEEVVYRVALVVVVLVVVRRLPVGRQTAAWVALLTSSVVFTVLPGHLSQVAAYGPSLLTVFFGMAVLWGVVVWATGRLWLAAVAHALFNTSVLPVERTAASVGWRMATVTVTLAATMWAVHVCQRTARDRTGTEGGA